MCAMSMVPKFRLEEAPKSLPTNTNMSMRDIPVMISGFTIGMFVVVSMAVFRNLFLRLFIPTAAAVPRTVDMTDAESARMRVFLRDPRVSESLKSSLYQNREGSEKTERLFEPLNENTRSISIGAKRNSIIRTVNIFDQTFMLPAFFLYPQSAA